MLKGVTDMIRLIASGTNISCSDLENGTGALNLANIVPVGNVFCQNVMGLMINAFDLKLESFKEFKI
eukprot:6741073-Ditylum_brightwellii.AAC.1